MNLPLLEVKKANEMAHEMSTKPAHWVQVLMKQKLDKWMVKSKSSLHHTRGIHKQLRWPSGTIRASASGAVDLGWIPNRVKLMTLKLVGHLHLPCLTLSIKGTVWRTSRQVCVLWRWERHLAGFPHLDVVDRWLATPQRARIAHWSLSRDRRIKT